MSENSKKHGQLDLTVDNHNTLVDLIREVYEKGYDDGYAQCYNEEFVGVDKNALRKIGGVDLVIKDVFKNYCKKFSAVKIALVEHERGWGAKVDDWMVCLTAADALAFKEEFNAKNTEECAPDFYTQVEGEPRPIELSEKQFDRLLADGRVWLYTLNQINKKELNAEKQ